MTLGEDTCCQTWNPVFDVWILLGGRTELTPTSCPLISMSAVVPVHTYTIDE